MPAFDRGLGSRWRFRRLSGAPENSVELGLLNAEPFVDVGLCERYRRDDVVAVRKAGRNRGRQHAARSAQTGRTPCRCKMPWRLVACIQRVDRMDAAAVSTLYQHVAATRLQ